MWNASYFFFLFLLKCGPNLARFDLQMHTYCFFHFPPILSLTISYETFFICKKNLNKLKLRLKIFREIFTCHLYQQSLKVEFKRSVNYLSYLHKRNQND